MNAGLIPLLAAARPPTPLPAATSVGTDVVAGFSFLGLAFLAVGAWKLYRAKTHPERYKRGAKIGLYLLFLGGLGVSGGVAQGIGDAMGVGAHLFSVNVSLILTVVGGLGLLEFWHFAHPKKADDHPQGWFPPAVAVVTPILLGLGLLHPVIASLTDMISHASTSITTKAGG